MSVRGPAFLVMRSFPTDDQDQYVYTTTRVDTLLAEIEMNRNNLDGLVREKLKGAAIALENQLENAKEPT